MIHALAIDDVCVYQRRLVKIVKLLGERAVVEFANQRRRVCGVHTLQSVGAYGRGANRSPVENRRN